MALQAGDDERRVTFRWVVEVDEKIPAEFHPIRDPVVARVEIGEYIALQLLQWREALPELLGGDGVQREIASLRFVREGDEDVVQGELLQALLDDMKENVVFSFVQ